MLPHPGLQILGLETTYERRVSQNKLNYPVFIETTFTEQKELLRQAYNERSISISVKLYLLKEFVENMNP